MVQFSSALTDTLIAPYMSKFTAAEIPDMSGRFDQSRYWLSNYILNAMLRLKFTGNLYQHAFNFLRRAEAAYSEHELARAATIEFLAGSRQSPSKYTAAIRHWEYFLGQAWHSYLLLASFVGHPRKALFQTGDGSKEEKLQVLYTCAKHAESVIDSGLPETLTMPIWLCNEGLSCMKQSLTWAETESILQEIGIWAQRIMDPVELRRMVQEGEI
jgi:hypothetical protein